MGLGGSEGLIHFSEHTHVVYQIERYEKGPWAADAGPSGGMF